MDTQSHRLDTPVGLVLVAVIPKRYGRVFL